MIAKLSAIIIEERTRRDLGDLTALADSIADVGLLHPPVVTKNMRLVAGARRIAALQSLGLTECEVTVASNLTEALELLRAERDENTCRKALTPEEMVRQTDRLWEIEKGEAKERQAEAGKLVGTGEQASGKLPEASKANTRDRVASAIGISGKTLEKARAVVQAAEAEPEKFAPLVAQMNKTGKVDGAYKELKTAQRREANIEAARDLPAAADAYRIIHGDLRERMAELPADSVDLIFTDPPYDDATAPLYADLAREAARVLKPNGSLLAYVGHNTLGPVLSSMSEHLRYWWAIAMHHVGPTARLPGKWVIVEWKPLVWFVKGGRCNSEYVVDFIEYGLPEGFKQLHDWQQNEEPALVCIEKLTLPGETVLDPFMGSGTTLLSALRLGRKAIGIDADHAAVEIAKGRLHEFCSQEAST